MAETTVISSTGKRFYFLLKYFRRKITSSFVAIIYECVYIFRAKWFFYRNGLLAANLLFSTNCNYFISLPSSILLAFTSQVWFTPLNYLHWPRGSHLALAASWTVPLWFLELIFKYLTHPAGQGCWRRALPLWKQTKISPWLNTTWLKLYPLALFLKAILLT